MLGTTTTKQTFASNNSIAAIPQLNVEWNYNSFIQPYVVTSTSVSQLLAAGFNSAASFVPIFNASVSATASGVGVTNISDSTASALMFTITSNVKNTTFTSSAATGISASIASSSVSLSATAKEGLFYKFVFYVKTGGANYTDGMPQTILATANVLSAAGSSSYNYRVVGVGSHGQTLGPDIINNSDVVVAQVNATSASVKLDWTKDQNSAAYRVYRSINDTTSLSYLTTTACSSYTDYANALQADSFAPSNFDSHVKITPRVIVNPNGSTPTEVPYYIVSTNNSTGKLEVSPASIEASLDQWKRVEVWFGAPTNSNIKISSVKLMFNVYADYEYATVLVDNIELYQITEHDFYLGQYYPTESVFMQFRPGEALLHPTLPSADRRINTFTSSSVTRPVSLAVKTPQFYVAKEFMSPQVQILPSIYDKYKYYISDQTEKTIQARYPQYLSINKIVLKYSQTFSKISSGSIILYTGAANTQTVLPLGSASFNDNGLTTLYYDGTSWSTSSWTSPPTLTASGTFQNVVSQVRGIAFVAGNVSKNSNFSSVSDSGDGNKMHIIELSPRLELDLSSILQSYTIHKDLSSPNSNGFPISYINSNGGSIELSNIPFYQTSGFGATVIENQAKNATFYGLMRQGVKFTGFLKNPSFGTDLTETIPQFVMYSNTWEINDFGNVSVELFDMTKVFAQGAEAPQYAAHQSDLFTIVTDLLAISGFSDYDYDGLKNVCMSSTNTTDFWFDEARTIFENLQDILLPHQIGAHVDEYGILRFKSLAQVFNQFNSSKFVADFAVTDVSSSVGNIKYIANIIPDSYQESISEKIGKILIRYKLSQNNDSADNNQKNFGGSQIFARINESAAQVWQEDVPVGLPCFLLRKSLKASDNYMEFSPTEQFGGNPRTTISNFQGDLFVGNEIIGYSGMEYSFYPTSSSGFPNFAVTKVVTSPSDIQDGVRQVKNLLSASNVVSVDFNPTGKLVGLQRGKYGTKVSDHFVVDRGVADNTFNFYKYYLQNAAATLTTGSLVSKADSTEGLHLTSSKQNEYVAIIPKQLSTSGYNLYTIDFSAPIAGTYHKRQPKKGRRKEKKAYTDYNNMAVGIFFNADPSAISGTTTSNATHFVEIKSTQANSGKGKMTYTLQIYKIQGNKIVPIKKPVTNFDKSPGPITANVDTVFDGYAHRLSVYIGSQSILVAVDGNIIIRQNNIYIPNLATAKFGAYVKSLENAPTNIYIQEVYADYVEPQKNLKNQPSIYEYDLNARYYFLTKQFMDNIIDFNINLQNMFLYQSFPEARGMKTYDIKFALAPIIPETAYIYPIQYGTDTIASKTNEQTKTLGPIVANDLKYSNLYSTPFRTRFVVANNTDEIVYLKTGGDTNATPLQIIAKYQKFAEDRVVEYVLDPNYINNSIELNTEWLASKSDAERVAELMAKAMPSFYTDIDITIFGNPLIQVGDFAKLTYGLKRVGHDPADSSVTPVICLATSVSQGFSEGVAETQLTLKPIIMA